MIIDGEFHDETEPVDLHCPYCMNPFCAMCLAPAHKRKESWSSSLHFAKSMRALQGHWDHVEGSSPQAKHSFLLSHDRQQL